MPDIKLTKKQTECWSYLTDTKTNQILFAGGAGLSKTFMGCVWMTTMCLQYAGTRYLLGRAVLTQLRLTSQKTLYEVFRMMGLKDTHYNHNQMTNVIKFFNGSEIILKDLAHSPSDTEYDSLGSLELTGFMIDEATQVPHKAFVVLRSRLRYKLEDYGIIGKGLITCNPQSAGWIKSTFYQPFIEQTLPDNIGVVLGTAYDNPHLPKEYIETLKSLPEQQRRRLLEGDWSYSSSINDIFDYDSISQSLFRLIPNNNEKKYISLDVARLGSDKSVAVVWVGLVIVEIHTYTKLTLDKLYVEIQSLMKSHRVHPSNVITDTDGIGSGLRDFMRTTSFVNNSKALHEENFTNLKSQCYHKLGQLFKDGKISININNPEIIDDLTNELLAHKYSNLDKDTKIGVVTKDQVKAILGRSPDISDGVMMRMFWEITNNKTTKRYAISMI